MGSLLGLTTTNAHLCFQKKIWLDECLDEFKSVYCRMYIDHIFALFSSPVYLKKLENHSNFKF